MVAQAPKVTYLKDYTSPAFFIDTVELCFELDTEKTLVKSVMSIRKNVQCCTDTLLLDGVDLELIKISIDGIELDEPQYKLTSNDLSILNCPDSFELSIENSITPRGNTSLVGLYQTGDNLCTHCEADGFRRITYFLDRPDVMAVYTTTLIANKDLYPILLANGNPIKSEQLKGGRHSCTWHDPFPKASYLFALVAGKLSSISEKHITKTGREIALNLYADESVIEQCQYAVDSIKQAMTWDEEQYGLEYDLDVFNIVTVADHNFGAMENKGLNIYSLASIVAKGSAPATDEDYKLIRINTAHEHFHNWSGNRVTCRDWFQLSLKEGLTTYRHCQYEKEVYGGASSRIEQVRNLKAKQFPEDASSNAHSVQPDNYIDVSNFYTMTVYNKGAEVVGMLHTLLGDEAYYQGCAAFFNDNDGKAVTNEEFVVAMEQASHRDLTQFRQWYQQKGTPLLEVTEQYDVTSCSYSLKIVQKNIDCPLHMPIKLGLLDSQGNDMPTQLISEKNISEESRILELKKATEVFIFTNVKEKPTLSFLRDFSAPVKVEINQSNEELYFILANDSNHFNRWDAMQQLYAQTLHMVTDSLKQNSDLTLKLDAKFVKAFGDLLADKTLDKAVLAHLITMPLERDLIDICTPVNVEAILKTQQILMNSLATAHKEKLLQLYKDSSSDGSYSPTPEGMAKRNLRNQCLSLLVSLVDGSENDDEVLTLCFEQATSYNNIDSNMTDIIAALTLLNNVDCPQRQQALDAYFERWQGNPLAIDKWFQVQAQTKLPNALEQVQMLMSHEAFDMTRPARVKSLIAWFFGLNFKTFHKADGSTYQFFADILLMLDQVNPNAVAWLYRKNDFVRWQSFDSARQQLMQQQMQRILEQKQISKGFYELVSKCLA